MSDQFVGEIRIFPFNFAPQGWALCNGQILAISQNTALFSLLGTFYGGNGTTNFALPNLQGNMAVHAGQGPGLSSVDLGEVGGVEAVTLTLAQLGPHTHNVACNATAADSANPEAELWAPEVAGSSAYGSSGGAQMSAQAISLAGGNLPHNNMQPYLVLQYCIALVGIFPARS